MGKQKTNQTDDMTWGLYRLVFGNYVRGKRINSISLEAEAWFWRINAVCDDFGNQDADSRLLYAATAGRRRVELKALEKWMEEMSSVGLISYYEVAGEKYLHVTGFVVRQPGGKNGRRVHKFPASPWDINELQERQIREHKGKPKQSKKIRVNPGEPGRHHYQDHSHTHDHTHKSATHSCSPLVSDPQSHAVPVTNSANGEPQEHPETPEASTRAPGGTEGDDSGGSAVSSVSNGGRITPERIYQTYPRHVGKEDALKAIGKVLKELGKRAESIPDPAAYLLERVEAYAAARKAVVDSNPRESKYTPYPASWLNGGHYADDPAEWTVGAAEMDDEAAAKEQAKRVREKIESGAL